MPSAEAAISVRDVSHSFGEAGEARHVQALMNSTLDVARGELLCLIGPSGCGKSTLLNIMGGLVTSTTVTWTFARLAKRNAGAEAEVVTAILAAWIVSLLRMTAIAVVIAPALLRPMLWPIITAAGVLLIPAAIAYRIAGRAKETSLKLEDPFDLSTILRFTLLLAVVMLLAKLAESHFGETGLLALGAGSGVLDVDPITLSMAKLVNNGLVPLTAAATILMAAATNAISKAVLAFVFGGPRMGLVLGAIMLTALGGGTIAFL